MSVPDELGALFTSLADPDGLSMTIRRPIYRGRRIDDVWDTAGVHEVPYSSRKRVNSLISAPKLARSVEDFWHPWRPAAGEGEAGTRVQHLLPCVARRLKPDRHAIF